MQFICLSSLILFLTSNAYGADSCSDFFTTRPTEVNKERWLPTPDSFNPEIWRKEVPMETIRDFKGPQGSLQFFLSHFAKHHENAFPRLSDILLHKILGITLNEIAGVKAVTVFFKGIDGKLLFNASKGKWSDITQIYNLLQLYNLWLKTAYPDFTGDLTRKEDFLKLIEVADPREIKQAWVKLENSYETYFDKLVDEKNQVQAVHMKTEDLLYLVMRLDKKAEMNGIGESDAVGFVLARKTPQDVLKMATEWVEKLHLSSSVEQKHIENLNYIYSNPLVRVIPPAMNLQLQKIILVRYFYQQVYLNKFPELQSEKIPFLFFAKDYFAMLKSISSYDDFYIRQEIRFEEILSQIENLNEKIDLVQADLNRGLQMAASLETRLVTDLTETLQKQLQNLNSLKVSDLNADDYQVRSLQFEKLHFSIERTLREVYLLQKQNEITQFQDLQNQWTLLLADREYSLRGLDYDQVIFSKDVIEYFAKNPERGSYFLMALEKGYVGNHTYSGLRKIPAIHREFRDIKVIKHGGKVRIVGKLINRKIHFFHIYDVDKPYDDNEMGKVIDRFSIN